MIKLKKISLIISLVNFDVRSRIIIQFFVLIRNKRYDKLTRLRVYKRIGKNQQPATQFRLFDLYQFWNVFIPINFQNTFHFISFSILSSSSFIHFSLPSNAIRSFLSSFFSDLCVRLNHRRMNLYIFDSMGCTSCTGVNNNNVP